MPIGVPRIIYCWGEELPAQWTDIYNFIFRRRMIFLMQYLDDELCNQICGLLINIHMEDRSKELERKEVEKSGLFKASPKPTTSNREANVTAQGTSNTINKSVGPSFEDLLGADEDLGIEDNILLEDYTLQKISTEWLNWNAQFFDYSEEPYLFYLSEIISRDFTQNNSRMLYSADNNELELLVRLLKNAASSSSPLGRSFSFGTERERTDSLLTSNLNMEGGTAFNNSLFSTNTKKNPLEIYSPFRSIAKFDSNDYNLKNLNPLAYSELLNYSNNNKNSGSKTKLLELLKISLKNKLDQNVSTSVNGCFSNQKEIELKNNSLNMGNLISQLSQKTFLNKQNRKSQNLLKSGEKALTQRSLKKDYTKDQTLNSLSKFSKENNSYSHKSSSYLDFYSYNDSFTEFKNTSSSGSLSSGEKNVNQNDKYSQDEESKKVFVIINSFGGSVGNGITVHDALQFIKAGSLTLGLGVAASAASLALAGGTIGERYVTEGCHVMIHQPEGGIQGQASDIWIDSQEIMKIRLDVAEIYSLATYRPRHKILRDLDRDFYLTASETIQYGLADEIATNEVMHEIIEMTSKAWDIHDTKQQRLLETRDNNTSGLDTQGQN